MEEKAWVYNDKEFRKALTRGKKTTQRSKKVNVKPKFRWTVDEEKYLLENLPKIGLKEVSKGLRRSPVAVRSKFLRLTNIINKEGRMNVSLKEGYKKSNGIKEEYILMAKQINNEFKKPSHKQNKKMTVKEEIKVTNEQPKSEVKMGVTKKNDNRLAVASIIISLISLFTSFSILLKAIL